MIYWILGNDVEPIYKKYHSEKGIKDNVCKMIVVSTSIEKICKTGIFFVQSKKDVPTTTYNNTRALEL